MSANDALGGRILHPERIIQNIVLMAVFVELLFESIEFLSQ